MEIKNEENQLVQEKQRGASLVEYALLVALIVVVAIVGMRILGQSVSTQFSMIGSVVRTP